MPTNRESWLSRQTTQSMGSAPPPTWGGSWALNQMLQNPSRWGGRTVQMRRQSSLTLCITFAESGVKWIRSSVHVSLSCWRKVFHLAPRKRIFPHLDLNYSCKDWVEDGTKPWKSQLYPLHSYAISTYETTSMDNGFCCTMTKKHLQLYSRLFVGLNAFKIPEQVRT